MINRIENRSFICKSYLKLWRVNIDIKSRIIHGHMQDTAWKFSCHYITLIGFFKCRHSRTSFYISAIYEEKLHTSICTRWNWTGYIALKLYTLVLIIQGNKCWCELLAKNWKNGIFKVIVTWSFHCLLAITNECKGYFWVWKCYSINNSRNAICLGNIFF